MEITRKNKLQSQAKNQYSVLSNVILQNRFQRMELPQNKTVKVKIL